MIATAKEIDAAYARLVKLAEKNGGECRITREQYEKFSEHQAWIANAGMPFGDDDLKKAAKSFDLTDDEIALTDGALLSWIGDAPEAGAEVLTLHIDAKTFAPLKVPHFRRWRVLRVVAGAGVMVSDTDDADDIDTGDTVAISRLLCREISGK